MTAPRPLHAETAARWSAMPIAEQLANVGSEVERTLRAHEAGNEPRRDQALARALELFDLTAADSRWRGARRREVLRAREGFCSELFGPADAGSAESLRRYFLMFALLSRQIRSEATT